MDQRGVRTNDLPFPLESQALDSFPKSAPGCKRVATQHIHAPQRDLEHRRSTACPHSCSIECPEKSCRQRCLGKCPKDALSLRPSSPSASNSRLKDRMRVSARSSSSRSTPSRRMSSKVESTPRMSPKVKNRDTSFAQAHRIGLVGKGRHHHQVGLQFQDLFQILERPTVARSPNLQASACPLLV